MTRSMAESLQRDLLDLFESFDPELNVAVGLTRNGSEWGVGIRSQDRDVDCSNTGTVRAMA